jgi:predicted transcriptional regulator
LSTLKVIRGGHELTDVQAEVLDAVLALHRRRGGTAYGMAVAVRANLDYVSTCGVLLELAGIGLVREVPPLAWLPVGGGEGCELP